MGQKSSKKQDLYVTEDVTHCNLPDEDVWKYSGRAREYTAADVIVEKPEETGDVLEGPIAFRFVCMFDDVYCLHDF